MSLHEKQIIHAIQQYGNEQLLDIKYHGTKSPEYKRLEDGTMARHHKMFTLTMLRKELSFRNLWSSEKESDVWWKKQSA